MLQYARHGDGMVREDLKTRFPALFWKTSNVDRVSRKRASAPLRYRRIACKSLPVTIPDESWDSDLEQFLSEPEEAKKLVVLNLNGNEDIKKLNTLISQAADGDGSAVPKLKKLIGEKALKASPEVEAVLNHLGMNLGQPSEKGIEGLDDLEV